MTYILAHDVGTRGNKATLVTPQGRIVGSVFEPYPTHYLRPLWAEQDPADWWQAIARGTRRLLDEQGVAPTDILALTFAPQMLGVVPVDATGQPLRPGIIWLDGRAVDEARAVMRKVGGPEIFARIVGVALTGKDVLPKLLWLRRNEPQVYARAAALLDVGGFLLLRATGQMVYEWTAASVTGLFDFTRKTWDAFLMRLFGIEREKFPPTVRSTERVGGLTKEAAEDCGLLEGTPVIAGAGDAPAAAVGSGAVGEGDGHISLGTSGWVGVVTAGRVTGKRGIATIQSADPAKLFLVAETETAGACLDWAARTLYAAEPGAEVFARMDAEVEACEAGAGGLIFTPWMYGERCPIADEAVRSTFLNLSPLHTRPQMTRAIYEGVAYNLRWMLESIHELYGMRPDPLRVIGGGAKGAPWLQIIADVTGRTVEAVPQPQQAAAVGVAMVAAIGMGVHPSFEALKPLIQPERTMTPNPAPRPRYDELYAAYRQVYRALRNLYKALNRPVEIAV